MNKVGDEIVAQYVGVDNPDLNMQPRLAGHAHDERSRVVEFDRGLRPQGHRPHGHAHDCRAKAVLGRYWPTVHSEDRGTRRARNQSALSQDARTRIARTIERTPVTQGDEASSNPFDHPAFLEKVNAKVQGKAFTSDEVRERIDGVIGAGSGSITNRGDRWAMDFSNSLESDMREYVRGRLDSAKNDTERSRLQQTFSEQFTKVTAAIGTFSPGTVVKAKTVDGEILGIVTGIRRTQKGKGKNPMAPSTIAFDIAVADGTRKLTQFASAITSQNTIITPDDSGMTAEEAIEKFDEAGSVAREERYIVTGNLLAGFDVFQGSKGQIVFFTDEAGNTKRGILLPRNFDTQTWDNARPVVIESPRAAWEYLRTAQENLYSPEKDLWAFMKNGSLVVTASGPKSQIKKYILDQELLRIASPVVFAGDKKIQRITVPAGKELEFLGRLIEITPLTTTQKKEIAQQAVDRNPAPKIDRDAMSVPTDTVSAAAEDAIRQLSNNGKVKLDNGAVIAKTRIAGSNYYEVTKPGGIDSEFAETLESVGIPGKKFGLAVRYVLPEDTGDQALSDLLDLFQAKVRQGNPAKQTVDQEARKTGDTEEGIAASDIIKTWERIFDIKILVGGFNSPKNAVGIHKRLAEVIRVKEPYVVNLAVASHEIAHQLDKQTQVREHLGKLKDDNPVKQEFAGLDYEPKGRLHEGWAEFIRHYVTEGDTAQIAPKAHDWFEKYWKVKNPALYAKIREARDHATKFADQSIYQRVKSAVGRPGDDLEFAERFKQEMNQFGNKLARDWTDRFTAIKQAVNAAKERGYDTSTKADPYELIMAHDMTDRAKAAAAVEQGVTSIRDGHQFGEGLTKLGKLVKNEEEYNEAVAYGWAKHAMFMAQKRPGYNSGFPGGRDAARSWIDYVAAQPDKLKRYDEMMVGLAKFNNDMIDMLVDAGALSPNDAKKMLDEYGENYFPLHRAKQEGMAAGSGQRYVNLPKAVKGRSSKGSDRPILDPFDATIARAVHFYGRAAKARVAHSLAEMLDPQRGGVEGMGGLMDRIDPDVKPDVGTVEEILTTLVNEGFVNPDDAKAWRIAKKIMEGGNVSNSSWAWFAKRHGLEDDASAADMKWAAEQEPDLTTQIKLWRQDLTPRADKATVIIPDAFGNPVMYQLDRFLYDTVMGMDEIQHSAWTSIFRASAVVMKTGATGVSSAFGVRNILRDYISFQGLAQVENLDTIGKPLEMLPRYIAYKSRQMAGEPTNDALIREFEELGGSLFSPLGADMASRQRYRKKTLGQKQELSLGSIKDAGIGMIEGVQNLIAASDVPPRLAAMEQEIKNHGYEARGGRWYNLNTRQFVDRLPEHVRIRGINAAAEATVNFKRMGRVGRVVNQYSAYFNATIQGSYREWQQIKTLPSILSQGEAGSKARGNAVSLAEKNAMRYLVYLAAQAAAGAVYWALRHDDDDYREHEDHVRDNNWTWGSGGRTYATIPKPRDIGGYVANLVERTLDGYYHGETGGSAAEAAKATAEHAVSRLPGVGGGFFRGLAEVAVDWDYFRDRSVEPAYTKDDPKTHRETPYTTALSSRLGKATGLVPIIGLSPAQLDHLLSQSTGGMYKRWARAIEDAYDGKLTPQQIPGLSGIAVNRLQARSVDDFYTEVERTKMASRFNELVGEKDEKLTAKKNILSDYKSLMTEIRDTETKDLRGRRSFEYEPYLVGLVREALDRPALDSSPNPFDAQNLPAPMKKVLTDFAARRAKTAILSSGYPEKAREGQTYDETLSSWKEGQKADEKWLKEHKNSPVVREALQTLRGSQSFRDLLGQKGRPTWNPQRETYPDHQKETKRWMDRVNNATKWLGDPL
jgi:hypothetical protein